MYQGITAVPGNRHNRCSVPTEQIYMYKVMCISCESVKYHPWTSQTRMPQSVNATFKDSDCEIHCTTVCIGNNYMHVLIWKKVSYVDRLVALFVVTQRVYWWAVACIPAGVVVCLRSESLHQETMHDNV